MLSCPYKSFKKYLCSLGIWNMEKVPERNKVPSNQPWYWYLSLIVSSKNFSQSSLPSALKESGRECMCSRSESYLPWLIQSLRDWTQTCSDFQLWLSSLVLGFLGPCWKLSPTPQLNSRLFLKLGLDAN